MGTIFFSFLSTIPVVAYLLYEIFIHEWNVVISLSLFFSFLLTLYFQRSFEMKYNKQKDIFPYLKDWRFMFFIFVGIVLILISYRYVFSSRRNLSPYNFKHYVFFAAFAWLKILDFIFKVINFIKQRKQNKICW